MGFGKVLLLIFLIGVVGVLFYYLLDYSSYFSEPIELKGFKAEDLGEITNNSQFYPNLRYRNREISYYVSDVCNAQRSLDIKRALNEISRKTILSFTQGDGNSEIRILCENIKADPDERGHFVAGEGGPSEIYEIGYYHVVFFGKVSLYREEKCSDPQIALHEIIHALGFDHNANPDSIMYPVTSCNQKIDDYIIDEINKLYSIDSLPDLVITELSATKKGRLLGFEINVSNHGFSDADDVSLNLFENGEKIKTFDLGNIDIRFVKFLSVKNLRIPGGVEEIEFSVEYNGGELDKVNNVVRVKVN